jgi:hypothetical protein
MGQEMKLNLSAFSKSFSPGLKRMPPKPSLHPTCYSVLRPLPQAGELTR